MITFAPDRANALTIPFPIPAVLPVTNTSLFSNLKSISHKDTKKEKEEEEWKKEKEERKKKEEKEEKEWKYYTIYLNRSIKRNRQKERKL